MSGGILLVLAGCWVGCQVLGGNALGRLGVISTTTPTTTTTVDNGKSTSVLVPDSTPPRVLAPTAK